MFLQNTPTDQDYHLLNDDLVGFFNSIPQDRLLQSITILIDAYMSKYPSTTPHHKIVFYYAFKAKDKHHIIMRGKPPAHQHKTMCCLYLSDVFDIVQLSFEMGIFTAIQQCWRQVRGTSMRNQLSPILCDIAVTCVEQTWHATHRIWLQNHHASQFLFRYVDNRLGIFPQLHLSKKCIQQFCASTFYQAPVMLEEVENSIILGCDINVHDRTCSYVVPSQAFQYRSAKSAGSQRLNLSGLRSRAALAARQSFPVSAKHEALNKLHHAYVQLGYPDKQVQDALKRWW